MRILTIALAIAALSIGLLATSAQAKGPTEVEVSGGDLKEPIVLAGLINPDENGGLFVNGSLDAPDPAPEHTYTMKFIGSGPDGEKFIAWTTTLYPATDTSPAMFQDDTGIFFPITGDLERMLAGANLLNDRSTATNTGASAVWYALAAAALGAAVLAAGAVIGRGILRRRESPVATAAR